MLSASDGRRGVDPVLLFRTHGMRSHDNMRVVAAGIENMRREEAGRLGMAMHRRHPRRVLTALRSCSPSPSGGAPVDGGANVRTQRSVGHGVPRLNQLQQLHSCRRNRQRASLGPDQLNPSPFVALVGQFQVYCRELHDEGALEEELASLTSDGRSGADAGGGRLRVPRNVDGRDGDALTGDAQRACQQVRVGAPSEAPPSAG